MKRLGLIVGVLIVAAILYRPATGQDNHEERIGSLETRVTVLEILNRKTAIPANTPRPSRTATPVGGVDRLSLTSSRSDSQVSHVDLLQGTWTVALHIELDVEGYVFVRFDPDQDPEGTRLIFDDLVEGGKYTTLSATVYLDGGPGTISIVAVGRGGWTLTMERET